MKKLYQGKDKALLFSFVFLLLCWISCFFFLFFWLRVYECGQYNIVYDQVSDVFRVVWVVLFYILPFLTIIGIVKQFREKSKRKAFLLVSVMILHAVAYFLFAGLGISVSSASVYIMSKRAENEEYYFTVSLGEGVELACDKATYDTLIVDENVQYAIAFRTLNAYSKHGFLEVIDLDAADNRR